MDYPKEPQRLLTKASKIDLPFNRWAGQAASHSTTLDQGSNNLGGYGAASDKPYKENRRTQEVPTMDKPRNRLPPPPSLYPTHPSSTSPMDALTQEHRYLEQYRLDPYSNPLPTSCQDPLNFRRPVTATPTAVMNSIQHQIAATLNSMGHLPSSPLSEEAILRSHLQNAILAVMASQQSLAAFSALPHSGNMDALPRPGTMDPCLGAPSDYESVDFNCIHGTRDPRYPTSDTMDDASDHLSNPLQPPNQPADPYKLRLARGGRGAGGDGESSNSGGNAKSSRPSRPSAVHDSGIPPPFPPKQRTNQVEAHSGWSQSSGSSDIGDEDQVTLSDPTSGRPPLEAFDTVNPGSVSISRPADPDPSREASPSLSSALIDLTPPGDTEIPLHVGGDMAQEEGIAEIEQDGGEPTCLTRKEQRAINMIVSCRCFRLHCYMIGLFTMPNFSPLSLLPLSPSLVLHRL